MVRARRYCGNLTSENSFRINPYRSQKERIVSSSALIFIDPYFFKRHLPLLPDRDASLPSAFIATASQEI
jgi:hypothetical protein